MRLRLLAAWCLLAWSPLASGDPAAELAAIRQLRAARKHAEALSRAERFIAAHGDHADAGTVCQLGGHSGSRAGLHSRAAALLERLIDRHPDHPGVPAARSLAVTSLSRARRLEDCIARCRSNLAAAPDASGRELWTYLIGACQYRLWRFSAARSTFRDFCRDHPTSRRLDMARRALALINPRWTVDDDGIITGYRGKYAGDPRLQALRARLPALIREARRRLEVRCGLAAERPAAVAIHLRDIGDRYSAIRAQVDTMCLADRPLHRLTLFTEYMVKSDADRLVRRLTHELHHALLRDRLGLRAMTLPKWVREGLAVHAAQQTWSRLRNVHGGLVFSGRSLSRAHDGLASPGHSTIDYPESALAFEWLEGQRPGAVRALHARLISGASFDTAFADLAGRPLDEAIRAAQTYARQLIAAWGRRWDPYIALRKREVAARGPARNRWLIEGGIAAYHVLLAHDPEGPMATNLRYRIGRSLIVVGRPAAGRAWLQQLLIDDPLRSALCDDAMAWIHRSLVQEGLAAQAAAHRRELLRDYSWSRGARALRDRR